jgi:ribosomal protein L35AE/L33A
VTAKYRGKGKWFAGKVTRVDGEGSSALYNVLYDDGDKDEGLREEFVKREGDDGDSARPAASRAASTVFRVGDRVTAKYRGKGKWFAGKVTRVDGEGSSALYNVLYDDGDKDEGLREEFVKREGSDSGDRK